MTPENAFILPIQIRFKDTDMAGHVNHASFVTYLETTRVEWLKHVGDNSEFIKIPIIIARVEIDYLKPIHLHSSPKVSIWVSRIGNKSYEHSYEIYEEREDGSIHTFASAKSVQVYFDYKNQVSKEIPPNEREILQHYFKDQAN